MFTGYGNSRTAGSRFITYGGVFLEYKCEVKRWNCYRY